MPPNNMRRSPREIDTARHQSWPSATTASSLTTLVLTLVSTLGVVTTAVVLAGTLSMIMTFL